MAAGSRKAAKTRRGTAFTALDLSETHLVVMALDAEIRKIEPRLTAPGFAEIEGLSELLTQYRALHYRLAKRLEARLGRRVGFIELSRPVSASSTGT